MNKRLLVSEKLLRDVLRLLLHLEREPDSIDFDEVKSLCSLIDAEVSEKLDKMARHNAFTAYKSAAPGPDRESLRKEYIELAQIRGSFTSDHEIPYSELS